MIDTKVKRASVLGIVQPDGTIDQGDRQTVLGIYSGILAGFIATGLVTVAITATPVEPAVTSAHVAIGISSSRPNVEFTGRG